jgi:hypothetical protein
MTMSVKPMEQLTAVLMTRVTPEEHRRLREWLFQKGSVSIQSFLRQYVLQELKAAERAAQLTEESAHAG